MTLVYEKNRLAVMPTYRHVCKFAILIHFLALTNLYKNNACTFSVFMFLHDTETTTVYNHRNCKRCIPGNTARANTDFICNLVIFQCGICNMASPTLISLW